MIKVNGFNLKGFKSMPGRDGLIMSGTLMYKGKPVATFLDEGCGGEMIFSNHSPDFNKIKELVVQMYKKHGLFVREYTALSLLIDDIVSFSLSVKDARKNAKKHGCVDGCVVAIKCDYYGSKVLSFSGLPSKVFYTPKNFLKSLKENAPFKYEEVLGVVENVCQPTVVADIF